MAGGTGKIHLAVTFSRRRRLLLAVAFCLWGAVWLRALQLQVFDRDILSRLAIEQSDRRVRLPAPRGDIVDSQGNLLAINVPVRSYFAYPDRETAVDVLAHKFASVEGRPAKSLVREWQKRRDRFTWMARRCDQPTSRQIESWNLPGVYPTWEYDRVYPASATVSVGPVGFVNADVNGAAGLEEYYDSLLAGIDGEGVFVADAIGRRFAIDPIAGCPPIPGPRLHLTLDSRWQSVFAEEIAAAVEHWQAKSGMGILLDPHTGAILAMVDHDPGRPMNNRALKNRLVSDVFEPGSTFKLVPFAAAIGDGAVRLSQHFDGGYGQGTFSGNVIHDDKRHGLISAAEAFVVSSNVVTGCIANRLDRGRLDFWARRFGFGDRTGVDLPGESGGRIAQQQHSEFNTATRSIGHGIAVTPLQLAVAYAAVANGGYLMRPHLVAAVESHDGVVEPVPISGHRILRPEVAHIMSGLMRDVVARGTAKAIADSLFPIAGKTGTAEKPDPATGRYRKNKFMASFVGFYPADRPTVLGLVILDEPEPIHYGGLTAAPVLLNTIRRVSTLTGTVASGLDRFCSTTVDTTQSPDEDWSRLFVDAVAPFIGTDAHAGTDSIGILIGREERPERRTGVLGETGWDHLTAVAREELMPAANDTLGPLWPDVRRMSLRRALEVLRDLDTDVEFTGTGIVAAQLPPPETVIGEDRTCRLTLQ